MSGQYGTFFCFFFVVFFLSVRSGNRTQPIHVERSATHETRRNVIRIKDRFLRPPEGAVSSRPAGQQVHSSKPAASKEARFVLSGVLC